MRKLTLLNNTILANNAQLLDENGVNLLPSLNCARISVEMAQGKPTTVFLTCYVTEVEITLEKESVVKLNEALTTTTNEAPVDQNDPHAIIQEALTEKK